MVAYSEFAGRVPHVPGFWEAFETYYAVMEDLAVRLMGLMASALDLDEHWFDDKIADHVTALSAIHYPALDEAPLPGQYRRGPHSDWGSLTVLHHDGGPGLPQTVASRRRVDEHLFARPGELADLGGVVDWQRQPVAGQDPVHRRVRHRTRLYVVDADTFEGGQLAAPPALPVAGECLGVGLDSVLGRAPPPIPTRPRDSRDLTEPGYGHARLPAEGVKLVEDPNSEPPFFHTRSSM